jgi:hypothetical protein
MNTSNDSSHEPAANGRRPGQGNPSGTTIVVNLDEVEVKSSHLNYAQLVKLAFPDDPPADDSDIVYTITISSPSLGDISLARGDKPVKVEEGMVCNVRKTGRS